MAWIDFYVNWAILIDVTTLLLGLSVFFQTFRRHTEKNKQTKKKQNWTVTVFGHTHHKGFKRQFKDVRWLQFWFFNFRFFYLVE